ncbi:MAG TPA: aspartate/glutamate racemase family protein [Acholeplasmataceae bacterium]|nr:aspartate/glutamate racemase family protein [Acholeplasmataceae bacterium]
MYDLGIIGGMGSQATVEIYKRIIEMTNAKKDDEHMKIIILNNSKIPDRTGNIFGQGESPVIELNKSIDDIRKIGAKNIIMACNTAHHYVEQLDFSGLNFISIISETLKYLNKSYKEKEIVILGTTGLIKTNVYLNNIYSKNLNLEYLNIDKQNELLEIIYQIKGGINPLKLLDKFSNLLEDKNKVYILGCTELSFFKNLIPDLILVDAMDCLIKEAIIQSGYKLQEAFK